MKNGRETQTHSYLEFFFKTGGDTGLKVPDPA